MNIRRLVLDVDKSKEQPSILDIAEAIDNLAGVEGANISVNDVDMATVGMLITVEGENIDHDALVAAIEKCGAAVHSVDEIVVGNRMIERVENIPRNR